MKIEILARIFKLKILIRLTLTPWGVLDSYIMWNPPPPPPVQNSKICHAVTRPKAIGLDRPQGPKQCFITCLTGS